MNEYINCCYSISTAYNRVLFNYQFITVCCFIFYSSVDGKARRRMYFRLEGADLGRAIVQTHSVELGRFCELNRLKCYKRTVGSCRQLNQPALARLRD